MRARPRSWSLAIVVVPLLISDCSLERQPKSWTVAELEGELQTLERECEALSGVEAAPRLERFARRAIHTTIAVREATVVAVYMRDANWRTRPYYALTYERSTYLYLDELDPAFQAELKRHPRWASVATTSDTRQMMFELALDETTFGQLSVGSHLDFTCELAAVIRGGKSVYCRILTARVRS